MRTPIPELVSDLIIFCILKGVYGKKMGKILNLKKAVKKKVGEINTPILPFIYP